jgi:hypothetical protein
VAAGQTATFSVTATATGTGTGTGLAYQWLRGGAAIAGATAANYTTAATTLADSGASFSVTVSNGGGSVTSAAAALTVTTVLTAPSITVQPQNTAAVDGTVAQFGVTAEGTAPFTYQWRRNGTAIVGATAASYVTPALTPADTGGVYSVVVTNAASSVTSNNATLTVNPTAPVIEKPLEGVGLVVGQVYPFEVMATGNGNLTYQWRRNGAAIAGATAATYALTSALTDDNVNISVAVTNAGGSMPSSKPWCGCTPPPKRQCFWSNRPTCRSFKAKPLPFNGTRPVQHPRGQHPPPSTCWPVHRLTAWRRATSTLALKPRPVATPWPTGSTPPLARLTPITSPVSAAFGTPRVTWLPAAPGKRPWHWVPSQTAR